MARCLSRISRFEEVSAFPHLSWHEGCECAHRASTGTLRQTKRGEGAGIVRQGGRLPHASDSRSSPQTSPRNATFSISTSPIRTRVVETLQYSHVGLIDHCWTLLPLPTDRRHGKIQVLPGNCAGAG